MTSKKRLVTAIISALGMLLLILDSKTALSGAAEGLEMCIRTVIPSLFPFFVVSVVITSNLSGMEMKILRPLGSLCGLPVGAESLLAVGLLGGYPVGAQCIAQSFLKGNLTRKDAERMLGFCNNAGPAFLFGIASSLFTDKRVAWVLWVIHIISALTVGAIFKQKSQNKHVEVTQENTSLVHATKKAVNAMVGVCSWILIFRVVIAFIEKWFFWRMTQICQTTIIGLLELANGCSALGYISNDSIRFIMCSGFLGFGGICVALQTISVTEGLGMTWYFIGKILQGCLSMWLAALISGYLPAYTLLLILPILLFFKYKKTVAFQRKLVYNK